MRILELEDVISLLRSEVERAGSQRAWANRNSISRISVNKILNGQRLPFPRVIRALKLRMVFVSDQPD